jgi:methylated-DNA-[protein]-cysteine S-methyltransferase
LDGVQVYFHVTSSPLGFLGVAADSDSILRVVLPYKSESTVRHWLKTQFPEGKFGRFPWPGFLGELKKYFSGRPVSFNYPVGLNGFTDLQQNIFRASADVAYGEVASYGEIARRIGKPRAARSVGQAMAKNPAALIIPCHRIIGSTGEMVGFSAPGGLALKRELLKLEGHEFTLKERLKINGKK